MALLLATAAAPPKPAVPANYNAIGIKAFQRLAAQAPGSTVFISPASIGVALSMVADGTAGATRAELIAALGHDNTSDAAQAFVAELSQNTDAQIGLANALWTRRDIVPSPAYAGLLKDKYSAQIQALRFGDPSAAAAINAWTKQHTLGYIDKLIEDTDPMDFAYLTNALSFDGKWTLQFKPSRTHPAPFNPARGSAHNVQMMTQTAAFGTLDAGDYRGLRMPYGSGGYAAYILLPGDPHGAWKLVEKLSAGGFDTLAKTVHTGMISISVPRFSARYKTSLNATLESLGVRSVFSTGADFSPTHKPPPQLRLSKVDHASFVRVDEAGTLAAAATSAGISMTAIQVPSSKPFVVDHPFVFAIRDERSGNLLFLGVIADV